MTERENLPAKFTAPGLAATAEKRSSLVARGMATVLANSQLALTKDNDALYRHARTEFDLWYERGYWNGYEDPALLSACKIFQKLANKNFGKAYYPLSMLIEDQDRAQHFTQLAIEWNLANQANQDAELWRDLGNIYKDGYYCVAKDDVQAAIWFRKAAEQGDAKGQWELGLSHHEGRGVERDNEQAFYWMSKAAGQDDAWMQDILGHLYDIDSKYEQAVYWFRKAADQGDDYAQYSLGNRYHEGRGVERDDELAVYWFRKAAEQGCGLGQWELGEMFVNGHGVAQDNEQALYWFRKAAEQDDWGEYQNNLGEMHLHGRGVVQDGEQAVYWFRKSAEQGYEDAQINLGEMYYYGIGVEQNDKQAVYWFRKAAEQGNAKGQYELGFHSYSLGTGITAGALMNRGSVEEQANDELAVYWFSKAAEQGHYPAQEALKDLGIDWNK